MTQVVSDLAACVVLISDLHAGDRNPYPALRGPNQTADINWRSATPEGLAAAILDIIEEVPVTVRFCVCAGDLSQACRTQELSLACRFLDDLADRLAIPDEHRALVPGNHDIDWNLTRLAASENDAWYDGLRQHKFRDIVKAELSSFAFPLGGLPRFVPSPHVPLDLLLIDTPFGDRSYTEPHHGSLGEQQFDQIREILKHRQPGRACLALLHHHPVPCDRVTDVPDYSQVQGARDLLELLSEHDVRLLLHGHQHRWYFWQEQFVRGPGLIVGAGTTTGPLKILPPGWSHTFQVLLIERLAAEGPQGRLITRVLSPHSGTWDVPLFRKDRVVAAKPFGRFMTFEEWTALTDAAIRECETKKFIKLSQFLLRQPGGQFVCAHDFSRILKAAIHDAPRLGRFEIIEDAERDEYQLQVIE